MRPRAVLVADVHYNVHTLPLADAAMRAALRKAEELGVPCIVAGDLHDTKALLRGECVSAMLATFGEAKCRVVVIPGNHDRINEKGKAHALDFLRHLVDLVEVPTHDSSDLYFVPYESDNATLQLVLNGIPAGATIIMHTGVLGAAMGHYVKDTSSLPPEAFRHRRVISGHYHRAQDIKCGDEGLFSYIGNPYTLTFGEAQDGPKGFRILMDDGSLPLIELPLRRHIVHTIPYTDILDLSIHHPDDLIWVKVHGPKSKLIKLDKAAFGRTNFKLDLIPDEDAATPQPKTDTQSGEQILDSLIDRLGDTADHKTYLKNLWRELA